MSCEPTDHFSMQSVAGIENVESAIGEILHVGRSLNDRWAALAEEAQIQR